MGKYAGPEKVVFQPSHWMDRHIAKKYLQWLKDLYPEKKIGLIWDHTGPHICEEVLKFAKELGITIEFINKGMTSVQKPCDLYANQQINQIIKDLYYKYRKTLSFEEQMKVKLPREVFVSFVERALAQVDNAQRLNMEIRRTFQKCGLDPYNEDKLLFA